MNVSYSLTVVLQHVKMHFQLIVYPNFSDQKSSLSQTSSQADTNTLLSAVLTGKGFKSSGMRRTDMAQQQSNMQAQQQAAQQKQQGAFTHCLLVFVTYCLQLFVIDIHILHTLYRFIVYFMAYCFNFKGNAHGKVQSSIKTNIKQGSSTHPYQRN